MLTLENLITLVRIPVILGLAVFISADNAELAFWFYVAGLLSHGLDGVVAERKGRAPVSDDDLWHKMDTVVFSIGLQIAVVLWLLRALDGPVWLATAAVLYFIATYLIEWLYIERHKKAGRPFFPFILVGSALVWLGLAAWLAERADYPVPGAIAGVFGWGTLHLAMHPELWTRWFNEALARPSDELPRLFKASKGPR